MAWLRRRWPVVIAASVVVAGAFALVFLRQQDREAECLRLFRQVRNPATVEEGFELSVRMDELDCDRHLSTEERRAEVLRQECRGLERKLNREGTSQDELEKVTQRMDALGCP